MAPNALELPDLHINAANRSDLFEYPAGPDGTYAADGTRPEALTVVNGR